MPRFVQNTKANKGLLKNLIGVWLGFFLFWLKLLKWFKLNETEQHLLVRKWCEKYPTVNVKPSLTAASPQLTSKGWDL